MMLRRLFALLAFALPASAQEEGFTPLFNGKDLSGWVNVNCAPETWTVKEGMPHCDGVPTGALRTEKQYENFVLELEWRHLVPGGNAGVFIWAGPLSAPGQPFLRAIEVQVLDHGYGQGPGHTTHGDVFPIHGSSMVPFGRSRGQRSFPSEERSQGSPEWNHYRITCQDGTLRLAVNGKEVSGGENATWRKGYIALESEGGKVDWRNLRLRELPGGKATAEQTAPVWDGRISLYNGRNLDGWSSPAGSDSDWKAKDWELVSNGNGQPLVLGKKPGDFHLQLDVRTDTKGATAPLPVSLNGVAPDAVVTDRWTRYHIVREGTAATCRQEGQETGTTFSVSGGPVELSLKSDTPLRVAGVYLKE